MTRPVSARYSLTCDQRWIRFQAIWGRLLKRYKASKSFEAAEVAAWFAG